jgi:hypothetical protein
VADVHTSTYASSSGDLLFGLGPYDNSNQNKGVVPDVQVTRKDTEA